MASSDPDRSATSSRSRTTGASQPPTRTWRPAYDDEIADTTLSDAELRLTLAIRRCQYRSTTPTNADLMAATGWEIRKVQRTLRSLERKGRGQRHLRQGGGRIYRDGIALAGSDDRQTDTSDLTGEQTTNMSDLTRGHVRFDATDTSNLTPPHIETTERPRETPTPPPPEDAVVVVADPVQDGEQTLPAVQADPMIADAGRVEPTAAPSIPGPATPATSPPADPPEVAALVAMGKQILCDDTGDAAVRAQLALGRSPDAIRAAIGKVHALVMGGSLRTTWPQAFDDACRRQQAEHIAAAERTSQAEQAERERLAAAQRENDELAKPNAPGIAEKLMAFGRRRSGGGKTPLSSSPVGGPS